MAKIGANSVRVGHVLQYKNRLWQVIKKMHTMPGKGGAFVQLEMKDILSGTKLNERFRSAETLDRATLEQNDYQYLYTEGEDMVLMDNRTFEQNNLPLAILGEQVIFLSDNMNVSVESFEGRAISACLPETVVLAVSETEQVIKGQTATSSYKPATMSNGARVMVPPFIEGGDMIVVKTEDSSYVERFKQ